MESLFQMESFRDRRYARNAGSGVCMHELQLPGCGDVACPTESADVDSETSSAIAPDDVFKAPHEKQPVGS